MYGSQPFCHGSRIYMRNPAQLVCIGDPGEPYHTPAGAPKRCALPRQEVTTGETRRWNEISHHLFKENRHAT